MHKNVCSDWLAPPVLSAVTWDIIAHSLMESSAHSPHTESLQGNLHMALGPYTPKKTNPLISYNPFGARGS